MNRTHNILYPAHKMTAAIDQAFKEPCSADNDMLFNLPVTKKWIEQFSLCLMLHGRTSFRGVKHILKDVLDVDILTARIQTISVGAKRAVKLLNDKQDLCAVKLCAHDELFHLNKPVLAGIDIRSLYCYLLTCEEQRDSDAWAIHFMALQKQGFHPERVIGDDGTGLRAAHKFIFPAIAFDYDNFHLTQLLMDTRRFFRNRHKTSLSQLIAVECDMEDAKVIDKSFLQSRQLGKARKREAIFCWISQTIDTLVSWMEHDVLNKAGPAPEVRKMLYDFIVDEFEKLAKLHPDRLNGGLKTYFCLKQDIGQGYLDLLRFFLNHKPFDKRNHPRRQGRSPTELLTGKSHPHWLEMLGYTRFKRAA